MFYDGCRNSSLFTACTVLNPGWWDAKIFFPVARFWTKRFYYRILPISWFLGPGSRRLFALSGIQPRTRTWLSYYRSRYSTAPAADLQVPYHMVNRSSERLHNEDFKWIKLMLVNFRKIYNIGSETSNQNKAIIISLGRA